jgi:hypothetical protein
MPCSSDHQKYLWPPKKLPLQWLVEGDQLSETRRRFAERKEKLDGLESNGVGGAAARGDPASMRSWLCRCMVRFSAKRRPKKSPSPRTRYLLIMKKKTPFQVSFVHSGN